MKIKTLVTGDDFGFSANVNGAVIEAYENSRITEASLMVDCYGTDEAVKYIHESKMENVGLHFSLCRLEKDGFMIKGKMYDEVLKSWSKEKLAKAFDEEIDLFIKKVGFAPKHVIGHKQIALHSKLVRHVANYCVKNNCYARSNVNHSTLKTSGIPKGLNIGRTTEAKFAYKYGTPEEMYTQYKKDIEDVKKNGEVKSAEFVFHPGFAGEFEVPLTSFIKERNDDINFLMSDWFLKLAMEENLELVPSSKI